MRQTEVKSTLAPWRVIHKTSNHGAMASTVTTVEDWTPDGIKSVVAVLEDRNATEANARLIAASPTMYSNLVILVDLFFHGHTVQQMQAAMSAARATLNELGPR